MGRVADRRRVSQLSVAEDATPAAEQTTPQLIPARSSSSSASSSSSSPPLLLPPLLSEPGVGGVCYPVVGGRWHVGERRRRKACAGQACWPGELRVRRTAQPGEGDAGVRAHRGIVGLVVGLFRAALRRIARERVNSWGVDRG